jgi:hypothetical protein
MSRLKSVCAKYASFSLAWMLLFLPVAQYVRVNFGLDVGYVRMAIVIFVLSAISVFAWEMFRNDRLPAWLRMVIGYLILLVGTLVVRQALGVWIFRRLVVLWLFAALSAAAYALILVILRLFQKKQERHLNQALDQATRTNTDQ